MWYVYILECQNGALYIGLTDNLERRLSEHRYGAGGHYTSYSPPKKILYSEAYDSRTDAASREDQIKRWSRKKKLALARQNFKELKRLSKSKSKVF